MYADDVSISFSANSIPVINERVNEDLDSLKTWLAANKLSLNVAKTHSLIIGSGQKLKSIQEAAAVKPSLVIGTETISMIKDTKYLGVYVDQHLSWDVQIANMVTKISKALGMLRYSKQYLPIKSVQTIHEGLVEAYICHCCPVWGVCGITALDKLQKLQNRAARIVTNSPYNASALPIIRKLGWQTVNDLIVKETLKLVYKCTNDKAPSYLACMFDRLSKTSTREVRNTKTDIRVPFLQTTCGQKCFSFREAKLWNGLDAKSKLTKNFKQFKFFLENSRT